MELSLRLDTLGMVEMRFLRNRDRYRDWPSFQLLAASRQAKIMAYMSKEVAEQLHQQILIVESAVGLDEDDDDNEIDEDDNGDKLNGESTKSSDRESPNFSPAFAQALERLNDLARQRLPEGNVGSAASDQPVEGSGLSAVSETEEGDEDDALEQLQDAFVQMMEVEVELVMVLQLFEEGRARPDDLPVVELQLDVDDFERLHETLDIALQQEGRSRRRK